MTQEEIAAFEQENHVHFEFGEYIKIFVPPGKTDTQPIIDFLKQHGETRSLYWIGTGRNAVSNIRIQR